MDHSDRKTPTYGRIAVKCVGRTAAILASVAVKILALGKGFKPLKILALGKEFKPFEDFSTWLGVQTLKILAHGKEFKPGEDFSTWQGVQTL